MPAPLGLVIGRDDRWPRTKETHLWKDTEDRRGFFFFLLSPALHPSLPLLSFLFWLEQGTFRGSRSCEISKKEELEKKKRGYPRGEDFAKRRRINYMKHLFFSRYLSTRTNGGRKGQWIEIAWKTRREKEETVTKWEEKEESSCSSSFSLFPRKRQKIKIKKIKS